MNNFVYICRKKGRYDRKKRTCGEILPLFHAVRSVEDAEGWISYHPTLMGRLRKLGYDERKRTLTPRQVELIYECLAEP